MSEAVVLLVSLAAVFASGCGFVALVDYVLNTLDQ